MKKTISMTLLLTSLSVILAACGGENETTSLDLSTAISKTSDIHADYTMLPEELSDLENHSDLVLKVKPTGNVNVGIIETPTDGGLPDEPKDTTHEVEVVKSYKGDLESGELITVAEPFYLQDGEYIQMEGYTPLTSEREYVLFLIEGPGDGKVYGISSMDYGKYSIEGEIEANDFSAFDTIGDLQEFDFVKEDVDQVDNYTKLKEEVLKTYN